MAVAGIKDSREKKMIGVEFRYPSGSQADPDYDLIGLDGNFSSLDNHAGSSRKEWKVANNGWHEDSLAGSVSSIVSQLVPVEFLWNLGVDKAQQKLSGCQILAKTQLIHLPLG
jgi:hypothetical protein